MILLGSKRATELTSDVVAKRMKNEMPLLDAYLEQNISNETTMDTSFTEFESKTLFLWPLESAFHSDSELGMDSHHERKIRLDSLATSEWTNGVTQTHASTPANTSSKPIFRPFESTLAGFRSFQSKAPCINPDKLFCKFDIEGGKCLDSECKAQHLNDPAETFEELIIKVCLNE